MPVLPKKSEVLHVPLGHLLPKRTHIFKTAGAPWLARGSTSCLLDDFGQILWLLHPPPPLPRPSPRMQVALLCLSCSGTGASPKVGEGKEKAGRCRTPLPSAFVRHRFPSQPWEQLARRCSSSRAASSSPSARFGQCLSAPRSTPSFPPQSWSSLGWLQPGSTSQDTLATQAPSAWVWRKTRVPLPKLRDISLLAMVLDGPCWELQRATATAVISSDY